MDEIYENVVGNTMLKILIANMKAKDKTNPLSLNIGLSCCFNPRRYCVEMNFEWFNEIGILKQTACGVDSSKQFCEKWISFSEALFHELCHVFHTYSGKEKFTSDYLDTMYQKRHEKYLWTGKKAEGEFEDDEETYNITGYYFGSGKQFDHISCNMFDIYKYRSSPETIVQRVFHCDWTKYQTITQICQLEDQR